MSKEKSDSASGLIDKALGVVPVLYYDLIARIIPGTAFIVALYWSKPPDLETLGTKGAVTPLILWIGAGYLAGLALTGVSTVWDAVWWAVSAHPKLQMYAPVQVANDIDRISRKDRHLGDVLFKMFAEATACENMLSGYVLLWIISSRVDHTALEGFDCNTRLWIFVILITTAAFRVIAVSGRTAILASSKNFGIPGE